MGCRNMSKGIAACKDIVTTTGSENLVVRRLDLSCMKTVRDFASDVLESEERLDVLGRYSVLSRDSCQCLYFHNCVRSNSTDQFDI